METIEAGKHRVGATWLGEGRCRFLLWAPHCERVDLHLLGSRDESVPMEPVEGGYHHVVVSDLALGAKYRFSLDDRRERPDPASRCQPAGVHGPSCVVPDEFGWTDGAWSGIALERIVIYEAHIGTFTPAGTFDGAIERLDDLVALGVTALEIMPVAQFPGERNWGYDGVYPFAPHSAYGGVEGLKRLVDACHARGLAVVLDVVYNHLGPEGNYLGDFGPYFTDTYKTPWGGALNFDGPESDQVRRYFVQNALQWVDEFHIDALRLDAVHAIYDQSAVPFLYELACAVSHRARELGRQIHVIAESDANDARIVRPRELGGYGHDAVWADDLHHALHRLLTGESHGYYSDYSGIEHLARALRTGWSYTGQRSLSRARRHGSDPRGLPGHRFVVCSQNHDQVGNRMRGERLTALVSAPKLALAAVTVVLSPFVPLLFMGEEYGETAPFPYFVSHKDAALVEAVRQGRADEFAAFHAAGDPPDPASEETFASARLHWELRYAGAHATLLALYRELLALRRDPAFLSTEVDHREIATQGDVVLMRRWYAGAQALVVLSFEEARRSVSLRLPAGDFRLRLDTASGQWGGVGSGLPARLDGGEVTLDLPPLMAAVYVASDTAEGV